MIRTKTAALILAIATACTPITAYADMSDGFSRMETLYGEKAEKYIWETTDGKNPVKVINCPGEDASVYTETNVRKFPSAEVDKWTTIGTDDRVKAWSFTDNGWCGVWCRTKDGTDYYGYIRGDLLNPTDWTSVPQEKEDKETEAKTEDTASKQEG